MAPRLSDWLEQPDSEARLATLSTATPLPAMVTVALQVALMVARWLLETELNRRAQVPQEWPNCPHCGSQLHSKGFQLRQMQTLVGAIAKHMVELHGGTMQSISPGEGQGATFIVRMPLSEQTPSAAIQ